MRIVRQFTAEEKQLGIVFAVHSSDEIARHLLHAQRFGAMASAQIDFAVDLHHMGTSDAWIDDAYRSARIAARHALYLIEGVARG